MKDERNIVFSADDDQNSSAAICCSTLNTAHYKLTHTLHTTHSTHYTPHTLHTLTHYKVPNFRTVQRLVTLSRTHFSKLSSLSHPVLLTITAVNFTSQNSQNTSFTSQIKSFFCNTVTHNTMSYYMLFIQCVFITQESLSTVQNSLQFMSRDLCFITVVFVQMKLI